ncbi:MAG: hypothetical protein ACKO96_10285 [Flammeovirgaceae bacterium]
MESEIEILSKHINEPYEVSGFYPFLEDRINKIERQYQPEYNPLDHWEILSIRQKKVAS